MTTPVTRGELREELGQLEIRFDHKLEQLETRIDHKLEQLETRFDQKLEQLETRFETRMMAALETALQASEKRMTAELARHANAIHEAVAKHISVIDEKYADLPGRVSRLETIVAGQNGAPRKSRGRRS